MYLWKLKHPNKNHHTFTNVEGMDDDIDIKPWVRVHEGQPRHWFHRFQHIYSLVLYGSTYLFWSIFYNDLRKYFKGVIADHTPLRPMSRKEHILFWASKVFYIGLFLVLPMLMVGVLPVLVGYGVMVFVAGVVISVVFHGASTWWSSRNSCTLPRMEAPSRPNGRCTKWRPSSTSALRAKMCKNPVLPGGTWVFRASSTTFSRASAMCTTPS